MRHTVFRYKFNYRTENGVHGPSTLEFIVSGNGKLPKEQDIEAIAMGIVDKIGVLVESGGIYPLYDFGDLSKDDFLDDVRKLSEIAFKSYGGVQLWFERDQKFSFWDDGIELQEKKE